ncbi:hypothetical protein JHK82_045141 [Glycine max]|nr:hypothetical protein JHK82_045141 [Glycine max]
MPRDVPKGKEILPLYVHRFFFLLLTCHSEMLWFLGAGSVQFCSYIYGGKSYKASSTPSGASLNECKSIALKALKVNGSNVHIRSALLGGYGMVVGVMNRKTFLLPHFSLTGQLSVSSNEFFSSCQKSCRDGKEGRERIRFNLRPSYVCHHFQRITA